MWSHIDILFMRTHNQVAVTGIVLWDPFLRPVFVYAYSRSQQEYQQRMRVGQSKSLVRMKVYDRVSEA